MKYVLLAALTFAVAGCVGDEGGGSFDAMAVPRELSAEGVSFGVGPIAGEHNSMALSVHFALSDTDANTPVVTDAIWMEAAQKAAPKGCKVASLTPLPNGSRKATYKC